MQNLACSAPATSRNHYLDRLCEDVAVYNQMICNPAQLPAVVDIAVRTAYARRGVAHLTLPNDLQVAKAGENPYAEVGPARPRRPRRSGWPLPAGPARRTCSGWPTC